MLKLKKHLAAAIASAILLISFPYHIQAQTNQTLAIDARFDSIDIKGFKEGLVAVQIGKKWGLIDKSGQVVVTPQYDWIERNQGDLAWKVGIDKKQGFLDKTGKELVKPQFETTYRPDSAYRSFQSNEDFTVVIQDKKAGLIDQTGKEIAATSYDQISAFHEGLAAVRKDAGWGYIDKTGQEVIPLQYEAAYIFNEGLAGVQLDGKWSLIDYNGEEVLTLPQFDSIGASVNEGLLGVCNGDNCGYINVETGNVVIKPQYYYVYDFKEGITRVGKYSSGSYGYIDTTGKVMVPLQYLNDEFSEYKDGIYVLYPGSGSFHIFDNNHPENGITKYPYDGPKLYGKGFNNRYDAAANEGLLPVVKDRKWGLINEEGNEIIEPQYDYFSDNFAEELALVKKEDKWGFVDQAGHEVVAIQYEKANHFKEGLALVQKDDLWGFIDNTGKEIVAFQFERAFDFSEGLAAVKVKGKWGFISHPLNAP